MIPDSLGEETRLLEAVKSEIERDKSPKTPARPFRLVSQALAPLLIPLFRAYVRYFPLQLGKRALWLSFISRFLAWRPYEYTAKSRFNTKIHGNCSELVDRYIYYFGVWEPQITNCIRTRLSPGDTFVDVGANIGYFTLLASKLIGDAGKVVAFEASPSIFRLLNKQLEINRVYNVRAINVAVLDQPGRVSLFRGSAGNSGQTTTRAVSGRALECEVRADRLDHLLTPEEARNARIIKIDVEGAEWAVIGGMTSVLKNGRQDLEIIVEVSPESLAAVGKTPQDLFDLFSEYGYYPYLLDSGVSDSSYFYRSSGSKLDRITDTMSKQADILFSRANREFLLG